LIALSEDDTATSAYSSKTEPRPANACAASPPDTAALPQLAPSTSLRRSTASATAPPSSPIVTVGTTCATPIAPTANGDRVISYTCNGTANWVSAPPTADSVDPIHSRRNAADSRSGLTSASSRPRPPSCFLTQPVTPPPRPSPARHPATSSLARPVTLPPRPSPARHPATSSLARPVTSRSSRESV
jgi:hypothetical protein